MKADERESYWRRRARALRLKINVGWWLESFAPLLVAAGTIAAGAVLLLRSKGAQVPLVPALAWIAGGMAVCGVAAFALSRRRFARPGDAFVRLESRHRLHNALTAAEAGVSPWPEPPATTVRLDDGVRWRWSWLSMPLALVTAVLVAAFRLPVSASGDDLAATFSEPLAWQQIEEMLEVLEEEEIVEPEALDEVRERIDELRDQPADEWFSHSSMEAADHERTRLEDSLEAMAADFDRAARTLEVLEKYSERVSPTAMERLAAEFGEGVAGLDASELPVNSELMEALKGIDPSQLRSIPKDQMAELRERLRKASGT